MGGSPDLALVEYFLKPAKSYVNSSNGSSTHERGNLTNNASDCCNLGP